MTARYTEAQRPLIALTGRKRSGKDTVASLMETELQSLFGKRHNGTFQLKFASPLKQVCRDLFGWGLRHTDGDLKEVVDPRYDVTPRHAMQTLGTEWGRGMIHPNIWVEIMRNKIRNIKHAYVIVSDCRFDNEAQMIRDEGGVVVQICRPGIEYVDVHESERGISPELVDCTINNDATIADLQMVVSAALQTLICWPKSGAPRS